jgi:hypothetical protein
MVGGVLADHEKGGFHVMRREEIEQLRRESRVRPVIERQGDVGSIDVNRIEGDLRLGWRGYDKGRRGGGIASFDRLRRRGVLRGNFLKKQETDRGEREQLSGEHGVAKAKRKLSGVSSRGGMQFKPSAAAPLFFAPRQAIYDEQRAAFVK